MTLLEKLSRRWDLDKAGQAQLQAFLNSPSGETFVALLREIPQPVSSPPAQPGVPALEVGALLFRHLVGYNQCLQNLEDLAEGIPQAPDELPKPFEHYGTTPNQDGN